MNSKLHSCKSPSSDEFMNEAQRNFFKEKLLSWRLELIMDERNRQKKVESNIEADVLDIAANDMERNIELMAKRREQMLIFKIDQALKKIEEGTYGFCEETGEPIELKRLIARPIATLSLEAQERQEKMKKYAKATAF